MDERMSMDEARRSQVLGLLDAGSINQTEAARRLGISPRQVRRITRRYQTAGLPGLISRKRGVPSNRRLDEGVRLDALRIIGERYRDFGPTLACEKLVEQHQILLSVESTRQLMIAVGYWQPRVGAAPATHPMRERRARFGEMLQIDGSPHDWFEGRSERCTLLVFIDDASGRLTQLRFMPTETTLGYMQALHNHILAHGVPVALYSDRHSIFRVNARDAQADAQTQFARASTELGIESIHAHSPQAKGRVERANQTLQDRLVKEMRLAGIDDAGAAHAWLPGFIADYNRRFAVPPRDLHDAHTPYPGTPDMLARVLSVQAKRTLSKNLSCQVNTTLLQIQTSGTGRGLRGAKVTLHEHFDGRRELLWRGRSLRYSLMEKTARQAAVADGKSVNTQVDKAVARRSAAHIPAPNHPWRNAPLGKPDQDQVHAAT